MTAYERRRLPALWCSRPHQCAAALGLPQLRNGRLMATPPKALSNSQRIAQLEESNAQLRAQCAELERWADRLVGILGRYGILVTTPKLD